MAARIVNLPTPEQLRELLRYEPETGKLFWKERPASMFPHSRACNSWNARYAGNEAFTTKSLGYRQGQIFSQTLKAHRVAWALYFGEWIDGDIDHINLCRDDNRAANLRPATRTQNRVNTRAQKNGKSGMKGASFHKRVKKWQAQINIDGRRVSLGYFSTMEEAHAAYCAAAKECYGEFARFE